MLTVVLDVTQRLRDKVWVNDTREDEDTETLPDTLGIIVPEADSDKVFVLSLVNAAERDSVKLMVWLLENKLEPDILTDSESERDSDELRVAGTLPVELLDGVTLVLMLRLTV